MLRQCGPRFAAAQLTRMNWMRFLRIAWRVSEKGQSVISTYGQFGREMKAAKLADWLIEKKFTADEVRSGLGDEAAWKLLAKHLGMRVASAETRKAVVEQMERAERAWIGEEVL